MKSIYKLENTYNDFLNNGLFFQLKSHTLHQVNQTLKIFDYRFYGCRTSGIIFAVNCVQLFVLKHQTQSIIKTAERKGKLVEKRGRKATGLKLKSQGSRVTEHLKFLSCSKQKKYCLRLFRYPFLHKLSIEKKEKRRLLCSKVYSDLYFK